MYTLDEGEHQYLFFFFFQAEDGIRDLIVTGVQTCALPIYAVYQVPFLAHATLEPMNCTVHVRKDGCEVWTGSQTLSRAQATAARVTGLPLERSEEHTSELQSRSDLVCRLLLEKKKKSDG